MREDILKALELWPLWTLRGETAPLDTTMPASREVSMPTETAALPKVRPSAKAALAQIKQAGTETIEPKANETAPVEESQKVAKPIVAEIAPSMPERETQAIPDNAAPQQVVAAQTYQLLASEDGRCLWVHDGKVLSREAIQLRHNMAKAMQSNIRPVEGVRPAAEILAQHTPTVVVVFGEKTAQTLLEVEEPLAELRGIELAFGEYACVASYDFNHLLAHPKDKRHAWDDLCLALEILKDAA